MKIVFQDKNDYILRFDKGEEIISALKNFSFEQKIAGAFFEAIGAVKGTTLAYYDGGIKGYQSKNFEKPMEMISLIGNISYFQGEAVIHCHGCFAAADYGVIGGHIKKAVISATCELKLHAFPISLERKFDGETGLNLLK